jgi:hypothetical protein
MRCNPIGRNKESAVIIGWGSFIFGAVVVGVPGIWDSVADAYSDVFHSIAGNPIATRVVAAVAGGLIAYAAGSTAIALVKQRDANKRRLNYDPLFLASTTRTSEANSSDGEKNPLVETGKGKEEAEEGSYQNASTFHA